MNNKHKSKSIYDIIKCKKQLYLKVKITCVYLKRPTYMRYIKIQNEDK